MQQRTSFTSGLLIGALVMYLTDPSRGRRRRAVVKDKLNSVVTDLQDGLGATGRNIFGELKGLSAAARSLLSSEKEVSDRVLVDRVRSKMGRYVSHPRAIEVEAHQGEIKIRGPILEHEVKRLLSCIHSVPGVKKVSRDLDIHKSAENVPALQGGTERQGQRAEIFQSNWSPAFRVLMGGAGLSLMACAGRGKMKTVAAPLGVAALVRAVTNTEFSQLLGIKEGRRAVSVAKSLDIARPPQEVFSFWSNMENFPKFMPHLKEVRKLDSDRYRWTALGPGGSQFSWTARITRSEPNSVLAWQSEKGSTVPNSGSIKFQANERGGTRLEINMSYNPPAGALGDAIATLLQSDLRTALDEGLLRLKSLLEVGKATSRGEEIDFSQVTH
ncbi:MAG: SRPBCC family protein [Deltaproteobacteria bacterium]|nr:SRPBCC family protein [Deltaproteobacteria bacterium]